MINIEISQPNKRLRAIREYFKLTQLDIAGNGITRNSISQIENGKQAFTEKAAEIIAGNFNIALQVKGLTTILSKKILLESIQEQVNNKIIYKINNSKKSSINVRKDKIKEIRKIINNYEKLINHSTMVEIYKYYIDFYYDIDNKTKALIYSEKAYEECVFKNDIENKRHFLLERAILKLNKELYKEAIIDFDYLEIIGNDSHIRLAKYNKAIALKRSEKYVVAIDILENICDKNMYENILLANCYVEIDKFTLAEKLYNYCLMQCSREDDSVFLCQIYRNLSEVYLKLNKYDEAKENIDIRMLKYNTCNYNLSEHIFYASEVYIHFNVKESLKLAKQSLSIELSKKNPMINMVNRIHVGIIKILIQMDNIEYIKEHIEYCINENIDICKVGCSIIDFFMVKEDFEFVKKFNLYFKKINNEK